jgi:hypothetical protein
MWPFFNKKRFYEQQVNAAIEKGRGVRGGLRTIGGITYAPLFYGTRETVEVWADSYARLGYTVDIFDDEQGRPTLYVWIGGQDPNDPRLSGITY